ncbi:MAG: GNAT family N-acetyltransferase [Actinomycetota bacterium]
MAWHREADGAVLGISQVSVLTDFGRRGIGTRLIEEVLRRARRRI